MICACTSRTSADQSATWGADNVILFTAGEAKSGRVLYRVPASGGTPSPLTTLDAAAGEVRRRLSHLPARWTPLSVRCGRCARTAGIYAGEFDSSVRTLVLDLRATMDFSAFKYARSGHLLYVTNHRLVAHAFDASALTLTGEPVPVADGSGMAVQVNRRFRRRTPVCWCTGRSACIEQIQPPGSADPVCAWARSGLPDRPSASLCRPMSGPWQ